MAIESSPAAPPAPVELLGVRVHPLARAGLLRLLVDWATAEGCGRRMYYANAHALNLAVDDAHFRGHLNAADVVICEGWGCLLGARICGLDVPEQLATMDWMDDFLAELAQRGGSLYLVGDEPGVAESCADLMASRHPGLRILGTSHGFWDREGPEDAAMVERINRAGPDVLMLGLGNPIQERWIEAHVHELDARLVLALGAMFRWYSGAESRAPAWLRRLHLEWLLRLLKHPRRHFRRYVIGNPLFVLRCVRQRLAGRA